MNHDVKRPRAQSRPQLVGGTLSLVGAVLMLVSRHHVGHPFAHSYEGPLGFVLFALGIGFIIGFPISDAFDALRVKRNLRR